MENPESKKIDELTEEDLKAVTGGADATATLAVEQINTENKAKTANKSSEALNKFISM
jgi:bacteriocin-like protein